MSEYAQWWLVMSSPRSETMLPVQPKSRDTIASLSETSSSLYISPASSFRPEACMFLTSASERALTIHIPSSAWAASGSRQSAIDKNFLFMSIARTS